MGSHYLKFNNRAQSESLTFRQKLSQKRRPPRRRRGGKKQASGVVPRGIGLVEKFLQSCIIQSNEA